MVKKKNPLRGMGRPSSEAPRDDKAREMKFDYDDPDTGERKTIALRVSPLDMYSWFRTHMPKVDTMTISAQRDPVNDWPKDARSGEWPSDVKYKEEMAKLRGKYPINADSKTIEDALNEVKKDLKPKDDKDDTND